MTGTTPWTAQDNVEPIQADTIGALANVAGFATISGCTQTYSGANLNVAIAAGLGIHTNSPIAIAGNNVTLVADPTNPRWTYGYINASGVAAIVSGSAAVTPAVPDTGANPTNFLTYVQANLTVANNATYKLDKRVITPSAWIPIVKSASQTVNNSTVLVSDADFFFTALAGYDYEVRMRANLATGTTPDWKYAWTLTGMTFDGTYGTALSTGAFTWLGVQAQTSAADNAVQASGTLTNFPWPATFVIHGGGTGGVCHFQWAQNTGDMSDTIVKKGSLMEYRILGAT